MNLMTIQKVQELLSLTGHKLSLEDFDLIAELDRIADTVTNPAGEDKSIMTIPVRIGKYLMVSPTINKMTWYNECALEWWGETNLADYAIGYMLQPHIQGSWLYLQEKKFLEKEVWKYARGLNVLPKEYEDAVQSVVKPSDDDSDGDAEGYGPLVALLTKEYNATPKYWMDEADLNVINTLMADYIDGIEAQQKSLRKNSKSAIPPMKTPKTVAINKFREQSNLVSEAWHKRN